MNNYKLNNEQIDLLCAALNLSRDSVKPAHLHVLTRVAEEISRSGLCRDIVYTELLGFHIKDGLE